nr:reverse transcriptase domain-containing protein [Tanacetum cinerariifolium]
MSTRSSARNLFPPLDNPELTIRRRSRADPTLLNDFKMAAKGNGGLPVPDLRTMEELCHPSLNGRGGPIAPIAIQATNFGLKMPFVSWEPYKLSIDQCPNHNVFPVTQIDTFYNGLTLRHRDTINAATGGTFMKRRLEEWVQSKSKPKQSKSKLPEPKQTSWNSSGEQPREKPILPRS